MCDILSAIKSFNPSPEFLSDIAAFFGVIIGIAIPLSIEIVSKLRNDYNSKIIPQLFQKENPIYKLVIYFISLVGITISLRFLVDNKPDYIFWKIISWFLIIYFFVNVWCFIKFVRSLILYANKHIELKEYFKNKIKDSIQDVRQGEYLESVEAFGDLIAYETQFSEIRSLIDNELPFFIEIVILIIQDTKNSKEKLFIDKKYWELLKSPTANSEYSTGTPKAANFDSKTQDEIEEVQFQLYFNPELTLIGFSVILDQLIKIHRTGIRSKNDRISRHSVYTIINILDRFSHYTGKEVFVKHILNRLQEISRISTKEDDPSMYASTVHWYSDVVFNHLSKDKKFNLQYLDLFNDYLFNSVKTIIRYDNRKLFNVLISTIVDGIHIPTYDRGKIYDLQPILFQNDAEILIELSNRLIQSQKKIYTQKELKNWLNEFGDFTKTIKEKIDVNEHEEAESIIKEAKDYTISMFKYNRLVDVINGVAAYLLFKNRPNLLFEVWEAKQPGDAGAKYSGNDLFPTNLIDAVKLFFRRNLHEYQIDFWDGHHGSEIYYLQYMVLVFMRILTKSPKNEDGLPTELINFNLPKEFTPVRLGSLEHTVKRLRNTAAKLKEDTNLLSELKFDITETDTLINDILNSFFDKLEKQAKKQLKVSEQEKEIAPNKVEEFKKQVLENYEKENTIHQLFNDSECLVNNLLEVNEELKFRFGLNTIDKKAAFFDEWHTSFVDWGVSYGRNLAVSENQNLFDKIAKNCEKQLFSSLDDVINSFKDISNTLIVSPVDFLFENLKNNKKFEFVWGDRGNLKGLRGYYHFGNEKIPVYEVHYPGKNGVLVLNKKNMGKLIQYSPISEKNDKKYQYDNSMFMMKVVAFSEDENLLKELLKNPPYWLKDKKDKKGLLKEHVLVQIFEKFKFVPGEDFYGYRLMVE